MAAFYDKFQLIAYQVPTDHAYDAGALHTPQLSLNTVQAEVVKLSEDAKRRVMRLIGVVEKAAAANGLTDKKRDNTLKIFMAPEFYFRPKQDGPQHSYSEVEKNAILAILKYVCSQAQFNNWLFVLGTIIWHQKASAILDTEAVKALVPQDDKLDEAKQRDIVWNTAVIIRGNEDEEPRTFDKMTYASADDIKAEYHPTIEPGNDGATLYDTLLSANNAKKLKDYFQQTRQQNFTKSFVQIGANNLWFALEVCVDHSFGVINKALQIKKDEFRALNQKFSLDFQLLTACGMRVLPDKIKLEAGRFILRVDGTTNIDDSWPKPFDFSEIQKFLGLVKVNNKSVGALTTTAYIQNPNKPYDSSPQWKELNKATITELQGDLTIDVGNFQASYFDPAVAAQAQGNPNANANNVQANQNNENNAHEEVRAPPGRIRPLVSDFYKQRLAVYAPVAFSHVKAPLPAPIQNANPNAQ